MSQILKVPKQLTSKTALETDTFLTIGLNNTTKPLIEYDLVNVVNQADVFEKERIEVRDYRFSGKINIYTANELDPTEKIIDDDGIVTVKTGTLSDDWDPLFDGNPKVTPNNWLLQILYPHKKESNFDFEYMSDFGTTINSKADMGPQIITFLPATPEGEEEKLGVKCAQKHNLSIDDYVYLYNRDIPANPYYGIYRVLSLGIDGENLDKNFVLDTPYEFSYTQPSNFRRIVNTTQKDIDFSDTIDINTVTATDNLGGTVGTFLSDDEIYLKITTQTPHNLDVPFSASLPLGSEDPSYEPPQEFIPPFIDLRGTGILNGIFKVYSVIDPNTFIIKYILFTTKGQSQTYTSNKPRFRKLNGTPSEYYVRMYKVLTTNEYDSYKCAFSSSIYPKTIVNELGIANDTWLYHFNEDIDVGELVDHNNKPLTELYLGFIKRSGQNTYEWSDVVAGWDFNSYKITTFNGLETISKYKVGGVGTIEKPNKSYDYIGDYAEYNSLEIKEKVISKIVHRFGLAKDPNGEGYFLNPFTKLEIMNFSDIIETSSINEPTEGIPNYAETYPNGGIAWRDLLYIGFIEPISGVGVDYPFINGKHYFYGNYNFFIRRQNPLTEKIIDQESIKVGKIQDVC